MKKLLKKLAILAVTVTVVCLIVDLVYRSDGQLKYPLPIFSYAPPVEEPYQIVAVGNSHSQSGITFEGYAVPSLTLFGVAQRFDFDLALLKQHHRQIAPNAVILIPVTPLSFPHKPPIARDGLQGNYYGRLALFLIPYIDVSDYLQSRVFSLYRSGYQLRTQHAKNVRDEVALKEKDPALLSTPLPEGYVAPPPPARSEIFSAKRLEAELENPELILPGKYSDDVNFIFYKWYHTEEFSPDYFKYNRNTLQKIIDYSLEQGWRPVLITIPISAELEDGLLDDYMEVNLYENIRQIDMKSAEYIDFSDLDTLKEKNGLFDNADHLNSEGAKVFSYILLRTLIEKGYLPEAADGYYYDQPPVK